MDAQRPDLMTTGQVVELLRTAIMGVLLLGIVGTVIELVLLQHYETDTPLQFLPLILIAAGVAAIIWQLGRPSTSTLMKLQIVMAQFEV
jgi:hypothetical protein